MREEKIISYNSKGFIFSVSVVWQLLAEITIIARKQPICLRKVREYKQQKANILT